MSSDKDWSGDKNSIYTTLGASNHSDGERQKDDYYATDPKTIIPLFDNEDFGSFIWECACGQGHLSKEMIRLGKRVVSTDLVNRGYGNTHDFLKDIMDWHGDIITNPPYKYAQEFVEKSISILKPGKKLAMFLKVQFLEGQKRRELFNKFPPKIVYIFSKRQMCAKNGEFEKYKSNAIAYAWFVWEKGNYSEPIVRWI